MKKELISIIIVLVGLTITLSVCFGGVDIPTFQDKLQEKREKNSQVLKMVVPVGEDEFGQEVDIIFYDKEIIDAFIEEYEGAKGMYVGDTRYPNLKSIILTFDDDKSVFVYYIPDDGNGKKGILEEKRFYEIKMDFEEIEKLQEEKLKSKQEKTEEQ